MTRQVFEGIKVADFAWSGVGPQVGRELADHGATVVRVESHHRPCPLRYMAPFKDGKTGINRSGMFAQYNHQKYSMTVDLGKSKSKEVVRRLVEWADIISDSMTPGTLAKWGLDYESCARINPGIIYFSTTQQGQTGPHRDFQGFGHHANALFGVSHATGWPDGEPNLGGTAYSDFIAPWYLIVAVIGALLRRRKTGKGMYIEQSQLEAGLSFMAPHLLDYVINGHVLSRMGNRDRYMAPHGVYPCKGADRWVAITVATEDQWQSFCRAIGDPDWARDARFGTILNRKANEDELDRHIGEWTKDYAPEQVMQKLQEAGVPAGVVETGEDLLNDPQMKHREHYPVLAHPEIGPHPYHAPAYRLSKTPCKITRPAPCIGEHNEYVYKEILGFSGDEIAEMIAEGVITTES
ncbi:MAG: CoA transferase [Chloroflexi bacterium]|nr:CoA transferase [Chloroflexota bacterium]